MYICGGVWWLLGVIHDIWRHGVGIGVSCPTWPNNLRWLKMIRPPFYFGCATTPLTCHFFAYQSWVLFSSFYPHIFIKRITNVRMKYVWKVKINILTTNCNYLWLVFVGYVYFRDNVKKNVLECYFLMIL